MKIAKSVRKFLSLGLSAVLLCGVFPGVYAAAVPSGERAYPSVDTLTLPSIFDDNMVLQQEKPIKIWGMSRKNTEVQVELKKGDAVVAKSTACTDDKGYFETQLAAQSASYEVYSLSVSDTTAVRRYGNVLIGEVWLSGGQSNMELQLPYIYNGPELMEAAMQGTNGLDNTKIRLCYTKTPLPDNLKNGGSYPYEAQFDLLQNDPNGYIWGQGNEKEALSMTSGVTYTFALDLFRKLNENGAQVPVAVINTAVGATSIEAWMSRRSIEGNAAVRDWLKNSKGIYLDKSEWNTWGENNFNQMTAMFNTKIAPLAGFGINGVIWYQGENNFGDQSADDYYAVALPAMVKDWSNYWGYEEQLPCVYMHLAPREYDYKPESLAVFSEALSSVWSNNRESFAQVPIYDIPVDWAGSFPYAHPTHPLVKEPVGKRAAYEALGLVYGVYADYLPPTYTSMKKDGNALILEFENVGAGLKAGNGETLYGFAVCGGDRIFVPAEAEIVGKNKVRVWSEDVAVPVAATYAFSGMNIASNLYNSVELPAVPFRTDREASNYYQPKDWLNADAIDLWIAPTEAFASLKKVWTADTVTESTVKPVTSVDTEHALTGGKSIKFSYAGKGTFGFGVEGIAGRKPDLYNPIFGQFNRFDGLEFSLYNDDARVKSFFILLKTWDGKVYKLQSVGSGKAQMTLQKTDKWQTFQVSLTDMLDSQGQKVTDTNTILANIAAMQFTFEDVAYGSVSIDGLRLRTAARSSDNTHVGNEGEMGDGNTDAPEVTISTDKENYALGDTVSFTYNVAAKDGTEGMTSYANVLCGTENIIVQNNCFTIDCYGTYEITVIAIDAQGNLGRAVKTVTVASPNVEEVINQPDNGQGGTNYAVPPIVFGVCAGVLALALGTGVFLIVHQVRKRRRTKTIN